jgi:beta-xylosidase
VLGDSQPRAGASQAEHRAMRRPYANPVIAEDCPDPTVLRWGRRWWLACTTGNLPHALRLRSSEDLVRWSDEGAIFPAGRWPDWAGGDFWAPELCAIGGRLVAYYTARDHGGRLGIGVAVANHPRGPWRDRGLLLHDERVGLIDPSLLTLGDGRLVLYWKVDGNDLRPRGRTPIMAQELTSDGLALVGAPREVLADDAPWEEGIIEAPCVISRGGWYWLLYSGNAFHDHRYATGAARGPTPFGPFTKAPGPILESSARWRGPGHGCVARVRGADWFLYHAWASGSVGAPHPRLLLLGRIRWRGGWPRIGDGGTSAAAYPAVQSCAAPSLRSAGAA